MSDLKKPNIRAGGEAFKIVKEGLSNAIKTDPANQKIQEHLEKYFDISALAYSYFVQDEDGIHTFKTQEEALAYIKARGVLK